MAKYYAMHHAEIQEFNTTFVYSPGELNRRFVNARTLVEGLN